MLPEWKDERTKVREEMDKTKCDALEYARVQRLIDSEWASQIYK